MRRRRRDLWGRVVFVLVIGVVSGVAGLVMRHQESVLDERGVITGAVVVETDYQRRLPDEAVVEYRVEGSLYRATLTVISADASR